MRNQPPEKAAESRPSDQPFRGQPPPPEPRVVAQFYTPLLPAQFDPSIQAPEPSVVYEGNAPETDEELQAAIKENPDSRMAKAQEVFRDEHGQRKWRYTEKTPFTPKLSLLDVSAGFRDPGPDGLSEFNGRLFLRNDSPYTILNYQVVLFCGDRGYSLMPPSNEGKNEMKVSTGVDVPIHGYVPKDVLDQRIRVVVEAQLNGPPGLAKEETAELDWSHIGR